MKRAVIWVARIVAALIVVVVIALWYALSSERVAQWAVNFGLKHAPPGVTIGAVHGRLRGPLLISAISYHTAAMKVDIDSARVDWRLSHLLRRQLQLDEMHVDGIRVVMPDSAPADTTPKSSERKRPHLPVTVVFGDVVVRNVSVHAPHDASVLVDSIRLRGESNAYQLMLRGSAKAPKVDNVAFTANTRGSLEQMSLDTVTASLLDGSIGVHGAVTWWPAVTWDGAANARDMNPSRLMADTAAWPGRISAAITSKGRLDSAGIRALVVIDSLTGNIRKQPLHGVARVQVVGASNTIDTVDVRWGSVAAAAKGLVGDTLAVTYHIASSSLRTLSPTAAGTIDINGSATGTRALPHLRADGQGARIVSGSNRVARITLHANVDLAKNGSADIAINADSAFVSGQVVRNATLRTSGTRDQHHISADVHSDRGNAQFNATGGFDGATWRGTIDSLGVDSASAGHWQLSRRAHLVASSTIIRLDTLCVVRRDTIPADSAPAHACVAGTKEATRWNANVDIAALPLALFAALPTSADSLTGTLNARVTAKGQGKRITGNAEMSARNAALIYHDGSSKEARRIVVDTGRVTAAIGATGLHTEIALHVINEKSTSLATLTATLDAPGITGPSPNLKRETITATAKGEAPDLRFIRPFLHGIDSLKGAASLDMNVSGTIGSPKIEGSAALKQIVAGLPGQRALTGSVDLSVNVAPKSGRGADDKVIVTPRDVRYTYRDLGREHWLAVNGNGISFTTEAAGAHGTLDLDVASDKGAKVASLTGDVQLPEYAGGAAMAKQQVVAKVSADISDLAVLQIFTAQVDSLAGRAALTIDAQGTVGAPTVTADAHLDSLRAYLPFGTMVRGGITAHADTKTAGDAMTGNIAFSPALLTFDYQENNGRRRVTLDSSVINGTMNANGVNADLRLRFADSSKTMGELTGTLKMPHYTRTDLVIAKEELTASLDGKFTDLSFIRAFTPLIDSAVGALTLTSSVTGTVAESRLVGSLETHGAAFRLPQLGILLDSVEFVAKGDQLGTVSVNASMHSGGGSLTIAGSTPTKPTDAQPGRVKIQGTNFEAANSAQLRAIVSPAIDVTVTNEKMQIRGEVQVPIARLKLAEIPQTAVAPSDDIVFVDSAATTPKGPGLDTDVRVVLGDSVSFSGFNFNAILSGALRVIQQPGQLATASGGIVIDSGTYKAYGQDLTIDHGKIQFAGGAINNPALDIRAARTADSVVAGLDIKGTLKSPEVTIFSQPSMSQTQALSYIATGHGVGQGTGSSGNLVSKALSALGLRGGNAVAGALGHELHLADARIQTEGDIKKASFVAGTYLSPNLYISYGIGLFDPVSTLRLRYMVSGRFTLQAETGKSTGADVLVKTTKN